MSEPNDDVIMGWNEHNDHAGDGDAEQDPLNGEGFEYTYDRDTPRTVISDAQYDQILADARKDTSITGHGKDAWTVQATIGTALAAVGFLTPPVDVQEEEKGICEATWPNRTGWWLQCGQDPSTPHTVHSDPNTGEAWTDADANAIPHPSYSNEPPF
ncbi:hypothetical protein [Streptomyces sp. cg35]|uniref:hypothetical protein n=1 Tax=Streptomyces sp. cg35 TaxID=3421650 RepID=UPI003D16E330